jgi:enterochelin esterase family protein
MLARFPAFAVSAVLLVASPALAADDYKLGPDSQLQAGVPQGKVVQGKWISDKIYPGTERDYWVYIPSQYDGSKPACLMVFQDGGGYAKADGQFRIPVVSDNLIHRREMPITIGVFLNPGTIPPAEPGQKGRSNRSFEYDSLGDQYARFLLEEVLPGLTAKHDLKLTDDPEGRGTCGISSGGICAFTVAWERPDQFRKVISHIGSFTNIRGGHVYPALIRKTEKKPLRVFLQDGSNDLDNLHGNWPLANQQMASSLKFKDYDYQFEFGDGGHSGKHGGMLLPDSLRWLWRDYPK